MAVHSLGAQGRALQKSRGPSQQVCTAQPLHRPVSHRRPAFSSNGAASLAQAMGAASGNASASPFTAVALQRASVRAAAGKFWEGVPVTLTTWLLNEDKAGRIDLDMFALISSIATACKQISGLVKAAPVQGMLGVAGGANSSGDEQKKLDVMANDIFLNAVASCGRASVTVTEEEEKPIAVETVAGGYICAFDPIDGSSNLDACISSGSIFGIYSQGECVLEEGDSADTILEKCVTNAKRPGTDLVAAGYCLYSSSTVLILTLGHGVYGFTLDTASGEFFLTHDKLVIPDPATDPKAQRIYSGNLGNVGMWQPAELKDYVQELQKPSDGSKPYAYRYVGALVPDFHRVLLYGGVWLYPPDLKAPKGKARLLYEIAPMSFIAEQAGGMGMRGPLADQRVLNVAPSAIHEKSPLFVGSTTEVKKLQTFLKSRVKQ